MEKEPTDAELQQFMELVDVDKSGAVSFAEFLTAITKWLSEDKETTKEDKKRKYVESVCEKEGDMEEMLSNYSNTLGTSRCT